MLKVAILLKLKSLKAQLQYPVNFIVAVAGASLMSVADILLILIPVRAFQSIGGWGPWELGFMFALWKMAHGLHEALFISARRIDYFVNTGEFDRMLVRPVAPFVQILASSGIDANAIATWIPGLAMFAIVSTHVKIAWNPFNIVFFLILILSGAVIELAVFFFISTFSFWFVRTGALKSIFYTFLFRAANYPMHIYGRVLPFILTFVFPFAFMAYYPTYYFFQLDINIFYSFFPYATPLVAAIALGVALIFWSVGLRHYQSSGT